MRGLGIRRGLVLCGSVVPIRCLVAQKVTSLHR